METTATCSEPGKLLEAVWGLEADLVPMSIGVSRQNWKAGDVHWLTCCDASRTHQFERETSLFLMLDGVAAANIRSPAVVRTLAGEALFKGMGHCWRVTTHVGGEEPDAAASATYEASAVALAAVHRRLATLPISAAVLTTGFAEQLSSDIDALTRAARNPVTRDPDESALLRSAAAVIEPAVESLVALPVQLVHGDWTPANMKVTDRKSPRVCGVLDFEFGRAAPVELDLAQLCSSLLMWSGLDPHAAHGEMRKALGSYEGVHGRRVDERDVFACMAVFWAHNYLYWRDLFERSGSHRDVLERQPSRIRSVLSFLEADSA
jgi:Ser/Thr protein kinase RdoA (MazF antagonist)